MSHWVEAHIPCPCGESSDAYCLNSEGWGKCFSCNKNFKPGDSDVVESVSMSKPKSTRALVTGVQHLDLVKRKIKQSTCQFFGYGVGTLDGQACHVAPYRSDGQTGVVAQKIRLPNKSFTITGDFKNVQLFGQHLWKAGGKRLVITEGEIDALSYAQATNCKWAVVSVPNGANGAVKSIESQIEFVDSFDDIVIMFDNDKPGQESAKAVAEIITPGKARIASLPLKDANDMLVAGRGKELLAAVYEAAAVRPDGIIRGSDVAISDLKKQPVVGFDIPYPELNDKLRGLRKGELTLITAGSGVGKSTLCRELGTYLSKTYNHNVANTYLEESYIKTIQGYIAIDNNVPLGEIRRNPDVLTDEQYAKSKSTIIDAMTFYNHFGSLECDNLMGKLNHFVIAEKADWIILDHISMVVSGLTSSNGERKDIDILMTALRSLIERTGVGVLGVVHLKRPDGSRKSFNEGGRITLQDLRGSAALEQLSDNIIAAERDQQGEDGDPDVSTLRVLKNREWGDLGEAGQNRYNRKTGRLLPDKGERAAKREEAEADFKDDGPPWEDEDHKDI